MVLEPPCGDFVYQLPLAFYFVYDYQSPLFGVFKTIVRIKYGRRIFTVQKNSDDGLVFLRVDIDVLDFSKLLKEIVALEKEFDCFVACVTEEGHE